MFTSKAKHLCFTSWSRTAELEVIKKKMYKPSHSQPQYISYMSYLSSNHVPFIPERWIIQHSRNNMAAMWRWIGPCCSDNYLHLWPDHRNWIAAAADEDQITNTLICGWKNIKLAQLIIIIRWLIRIYFEMCWPVSTKIIHNI